MNDFKDDIADLKEKIADLDKKLELYVQDTRHDLEEVIRTNCLQNEMLASQQTRVQKLEGPFKWLKNTWQLLLWSGAVCGLLFAYIKLFIWISYLVN